MAWPVDELRRWMDELEARRATASHFDVLGLPRDADDAAVRAAFHRIAGSAHPDAHRRLLAPADYERLVRTYSMVTLAYMSLRHPAARARYLATLPAAAPAVSPRPPAAAAGRVTATGAAAAPARGPSGTARAQLYARKGEAAWRAGDLAAAVFNLRLALAADPSSQSIRAALAQVETEAKQKGG